MADEPLVNDVVVDPDGTRNEPHPYEPLGPNVSDGFCLRCGRDSRHDIHSSQGEVHHYEVDSDGAPCCDWPMDDVIHHVYGCERCSWSATGCMHCRPAVSAVDRMLADDAAEEDLEQIVRDKIARAEEGTPE